MNIRVLKYILIRRSYTYKFQTLRIKVKHIRM